MGHSAGAHLAASLALDSRHLASVGGEPAWIRGLIGLSGPYGLVPPPTKFWSSVFPEPYTADDWQPLRHASRISPPTLLLYGAQDWEMAQVQAEELAMVLQSLDIRVVAHRYPGTSHFGTVAAFSLLSFMSAPVTRDIDAFIDATVTAPGTSVESRAPSASKPGWARKPRPLDDALRRQEQSRLVFPSCRRLACRRQLGFADRSAPAP